MVRHGQASFHAADYDQLSDTGVKQAQLLGKWFQHCAWPVHQVVAGGMKRHLQTAEEFLSAYPLIADGPVQLRREPRLNEFDHQEILQRSLVADNPNEIIGHMKEMAPEEFKVKMFKALVRWASAGNDNKYSEPWPVFSDRCVAALEGMAELADTGDNVVVFTSVGVIAAILRNILDLSAEQMVSLLWEITNASFTCITFKEGHYAVNAFNVTAHLDQTRQPELITLK